MLFGGNSGNVQKTSDGPVSRYLNRPLSIRITRLLLKTKITPNHVSIFAFILSIRGVVFFFLGGYFNLIIGAIMSGYLSFYWGH